MFSKSKQSPEAPAATPHRGRESMSSGHTFSIIASDVEIIGNLAAKVDLHIDGKIQGDVACGNLVQGADSVITGKVIAQSARLSGRVEGSIEAGDLIIEASAKINGDVSYESLSIAPGGQIDGKFKHKSAGGPNIRRSTVEIGKVDPLILGEESQVA